MQTACLSSLSLFLSNRLQAAAVHQCPLHIQCSASKIRCLTEALRASSSRGKLYTATEPSQEAKPARDWHLAAFEKTKCHHPGDAPL